MAALTFFLMPAPTVLFDADLAPIVTLPAGYFVMQSDATAPEGFLSVVYDDLTGFVRTADVRAVDYRPVTKYETTVKFKCSNDGQPVNLRSAPRKGAQILSVLENNASGRCYGSIEGETLITGADSVWYYVSCNGVKGYCYYAHVAVDETPPNIIEKEPEEQPTEPTDAPPAETAELPSAAVIILIVALCIPVPFVMFYLFKKPKQ